uniref:F-box domain-containing protein n=1 Tax=Steinernema glaseri TaxID=37863 RepID=A0A1I7YI95_9BILA
MGASTSRKKSSPDVCQHDDTALSPFLLSEQIQYLLFTKYFALHDLLRFRLVSREWKARIEEVLPRLRVDIRFNAFLDRVDVECKRFAISTFPVNAAVAWPPNVEVRSIKWHSYHDDCKRSNFKRLMQVLRLPNCKRLEELQLGMTESQVPREVLQPTLSLKALIAIRKNWIKRPFAILEGIENILRSSKSLKRFELSYNGDHERLLKLFAINPLVSEFCICSDNFTSEEIVGLVHSIPEDRSRGSMSLSYVNDDQYDQVLLELGDDLAFFQRSFKLHLEKTDVYEMTIRIN